MSTIDLITSDDNQNNTPIVYSKIAQTILENTNSQQSTYN